MVRGRVIKQCSCAVLLAVAIALLTARADANEECNGRGHKKDGQCVCNTPTPSFGELGYVGAECELRVFGTPIDGTDMASSCGSNTCNELQIDEWVCFYSPIDWNSSTDPWNFLAVQLNRTSDGEHGDPDLYGMFYNADEASFPEVSTYKYQFKETSSSSRRSVVKRIKKADFTGHAYEGVYFCIKAYGEEELTFSLKATRGKCPVGFSHTGEKMECSTEVTSGEKRHTGCNDDGTCICKSPYAKPLAQIYEGTCSNPQATPATPLTPYATALWLFTIDLGVASGAGLYEHLIVLPEWFPQSPSGTSLVDAAKMRRTDTGRRFWAGVTTLPLTLLTLGSGIAAWRLPATLPPLRHPWLIAVGATAIERLATFLFFIPTALKLMGEGRDALPPERVAILAWRWQRASVLRIALCFLAWMAAMLALSLSNASVA